MCYNFDFVLPPKWAGWCTDGATNIASQSNGVWRSQ